MTNSNTTKEPKYSRIWGRLGQLGVASTVVGRLDFVYRKRMAKSISRTGKRGRGRPRINPTSIHLSLAPDLLARLDQFLADQKDNPSRPEAVRRLVELGLAGMQPMRRRSPKATSKALDLA